MRIKLTLKPLNKVCSIPINYQYPISSAIYKVLSHASNDYAQWLHNHGYLSLNKKPMKLFVFSKLLIPNRKIENNKITIFDFCDCTLFVSSPLSKDFIQHFVVGLFQQQEIEIGSQYTVGRFVIHQVETLADPLISSENKFTCLSPIVVSSKHLHKGKEKIYYIRPDDPQLNEAIRNNLVQKFQTIYQKLPEKSQLIFTLDKNYIQRKGGYQNISKLITIKEGNKNEQTQIKSFLAPFTLEGSIELIQIAYDCGIGEKNSLGFGMIELVGQKDNKMKRN